MKRMLKLGVIAAIIAFALSSCLTIEDHYTMKANGSGSMKTIIDMSEMKSLLEMVAEEGSEGNPMDELNFQDLAVELRGQNGISNIAVNENKEDLVFEISFDFDDVSSLNRGLSSLGRNSANGNMTNPSKGVFASNFELGEMLPMNELLGGADDAGEEGMEKVQMLLNQMKYTIHLHFQKPVQAVYGGAGADIKYEDKSGKNVVIAADFAEIINNKSVLSWTAVTK
mgnify:CR=1 FL=1